MKHLCTRFGLNYLFGLANFTLGVTLGGIVVAGCSSGRCLFHWPALVRMEPLRVFTIRRPSLSQGARAASPNPSPSGA
jgi:hypothetical protein